jgi:hypothetical protein
MSEFDDKSFGLCAYVLSSRKRWLQNALTLNVNFEVIRLEKYKMHILEHEVSDLHELF